MTNWKVYKITSKWTFPMEPLFEGIKFSLDGDVPYKGIKKNDIYFMVNNKKYEHNSKIYDCESYQIGDYLEINIDETINHSLHGFNEDVRDLSNIVRKLGSLSMTTTRNAMINASSANPTALAVTRDLADRVDRGEETHFKYEIEDNGVKHSWIYKRN